MRSLVAIILLLLWLTPKANAKEPLKMKFVLDVADLMPDGIQVKGSSQGMAVYLSFHTPGRPSITLSISFALPTLNSYLAKIRFSTA